MNKLIAIGLVTFTGFAGIAAVAPASAAPLGSAPYCSSSADITNNEATIKQQLRGYGYDVQSVQEWNGCVRAFVTNKDGTGEHSAYFDPDTLRLITTTGQG